MRKNIYRSSLLMLMLTTIIGCGQKKEESKNEEAAMANENENMKTLYIGSYTKEEGHVNGQADGIYTLYQNPKDGSLQKGKTVAEVVNPSFVKVADDGEFLFAVSELGENDAESGFAYSFRIHEGDSLEQLSKVSTEGFAPAHVETDKSGNFVFVSNYMGGVVMMYKKNNDGTLQKQQRIDLENPQESHAHSVTISEDNQHAYIADLGNDKIWIFDFDDEEGNLVPNAQASVELEEGTGPRHFTFSENGDFAYSINELNSSVSVFRVLSNGGLETVQNISSLPEGFSEENSAADIHFHPSGEFLYVSNRGHNSIAFFKVNGESGELSSPDFTSTRGETPRNFAISPEGDFLYAANQDSNSIAIFEIDQETGKLNLKGDPVEAMTPVCVEFAE